MLGRQSERAGERCKESENLHFAEKKAWHLRELRERTDMEEALARKCQEVPGQVFSAKKKKRRVWKGDRRQRTHIAA